MAGSTQILGPDGLPIASVPVDPVTGRWTYQANGQPGVTTAVFTGAGQTRKIAGDAYVQANDLMLGEFPEILQSFRDGVYGDAVMPLSAPGGMAVRVGVGNGFVLGRFMPVYTAQDLPVSAAHATLSRIDAIVMRLTRTGTFAGKLELAVVAGTPAATPLPPVLTKSSATWEVKIGEVAVAAAAAAITAGNLSETGRRYAGPRYGRVLVAKRAFAADIAVSIDDVFTADFRHYEGLIAVDSATNAAGQLRMNVRTDRANAASTYDWTHVARTGGGSDGVTSAAADGDVFVAPTWFNGDVDAHVHLKIENPFVTRRTRLTWVGAQNTAANTQQYVYGHAQYRAIESVDGLRIRTVNGTMTGNIYLFGVGL